MLDRHGAVALVYNGHQVTPCRRPPAPDDLAQLIGWYTREVDVEQLLADVQAFRGERVRVRRHYVRRA